jgi:hypothetical protein
LTRQPHHSSSSCKDGIPFHPAGSTKSAEPPEHTISFKLQGSDAQVGSAARFNYRKILIWNRILGHDIVTIYVGRKRKRFTVHKKLICDRSSFFARALNSSFKEAQDGVMYLPEDNADAFSSLVDFLYRRTVTWIARGTNSCGHRDLYYLAEKLCMSELMDRAMDKIHSYCVREEGSFTSKLLVMKIYGNTHEKSKLRQLCAAQTAASISTDDQGPAWSESSSEIFTNCPEFFLDTFRFQATHVKIIWGESWSSSKLSSRTRIFGACEFYTHENDEDCYLKNVKQNQTLENGSH